RSSTLLPLFASLTSLTASPSLFPFSSSPPPPDLPSFPTRRSSDLRLHPGARARHAAGRRRRPRHRPPGDAADRRSEHPRRHSLSDRKSTRLNSSHEWISYAVFCLKKKKNNIKEVIRRHAVEQNSAP